MKAIKFLILIFNLIVVLLILFVIYEELFHYSIRPFNTTTGLQFVMLALIFFSSFTLILYFIRDIRNSKLTISHHKENNQIIDSEEIFSSEYFTELIEFHPLIFWTVIFGTAQILIVIYFYCSIPWHNLFLSKDPIPKLLIIGLPLLFLLSGAFSIFFSLQKKIKF